MRKGVDYKLFNLFEFNRKTGDTKLAGRKYARPAYGVKTLKRRHLAKKAAKQARRWSR